MTARFTRLTGTLALAAGLAATMLGMSPAAAAEAPVGLGTAASFAVLAGSTVTNTGPSVISGDLGVSPGTAVTGFPPGSVNNGTIHAADAVAAQAQLDVTTAYNDAAGRSASAAVTADLGGQTLVSGVYSGPTLGLNGTVTLDAQGDPNAVFVFQAGSTLITGTTSVVALINGAQACNVYWQVGSSATLGTSSTFVGTVLALTSITANTNATVMGRLLARNAAVTLDSNTIVQPDCASETTTTTTTAPTTTTDGTALTTTPGTGGVGGSGGTTGGDGTTGTEAGTTSGGASGSGGTMGIPGIATPDGGTTGGGTPGGGAPRLPATGRGLSAMALAGLVAIALGAAALEASRRPALR